MIAKYCTIEFGFEYNSSPPMIANASFPCLLNYIKFFYYENIHEYTKEELYNEFPCTSLSFSNYQFFFQSSVINLLPLFCLFAGII